MVEFPSEAALAVYSGLMVSKFDDLHGAITTLLGWPVFTHHLASSAVAEAAARAAREQVSWLVDEAVVLRCEPWTQEGHELTRGEVDAGYAEWLAGLHERRGELVTLVEPAEPVGAMSPFDGIPEGPTVIAVVLDED